MLHCPANACYNRYMCSTQRNCHHIAGDECPFCNAGQKRKITAENVLAVATPDNYPVSPGHTLIVPRRHVADYFDLSAEEKAAIDALLAVCRERLLAEDGTIAGFNVGVNCGEAAGQGIFHCHVHMIPRRRGDSPDPKGGVRCVVPRDG